MTDDIQAEVIPSKKRPYFRAQLNTVHHVCVELAAIYRQCRRGELELSAGTKYAFMLQTLGRLLETATLEQRLDALESESAQVFINEGGGFTDGNETAEKTSLCTTAPTEDRET